MTQKRGQLTERIKKESLHLLGYEIGVTELRLMPYVIYVVMNEHKIDPLRIDQEEKDILFDWKTAGYINGGIDKFQITPEFWDICCKIIYLGYVDIDEHVTARNGRNGI